MFDQMLFILWLILKRSEHPLKPFWSLLIRQLAHLLLRIILRRHWNNRAELESHTYLLRFLRNWWPSPSNLSWLNLFYTKISAKQCLIVLLQTVGITIYNHFKLIAIKMAVNHYVIFVAVHKIYWLVPLLCHQLF